MSNIDPTQPAYGDPTTQSVRTNFQTAANEIDAATATANAAVKRAGDTMTGPLTLAGDAVAPLQPATLEQLQKYLPLAGNATVTGPVTFTAPLSLPGNANSPLQAVPLQQMQVAIGGGLPEAPSDGGIYGRRGSTGTWVATLPLAGGTLTGGLTMSSAAIVMSGAGATITLAADPAAALQPVTLQYYNAHLPAVPAASTSAPAMNGTATAGASGAWSRGDHVHPSDTSRLSTTGGTLSGPVTATQFTVSGAANLYFGGGGSRILNLNSNTYVSGSGDLNLVNDSGNHVWMQTTNGWWRVEGGGNILASTGNCYKPGGGTWVDSSDVRGKHVLGEYQAGLAAVLQLKPIRFKFRGNIRTLAPQAQSADDPPPPFTISEPLHAQAAKAGTEFVGLSAQDCEAIMPEMVMRGPGVIDDRQVDDLRSLNTSPLIYAVVNALREIDARLRTIETLLDTKGTA